MINSNMDNSFRKTGIICSKTGEKLGTIEEELYNNCQHENKKKNKNEKEATPKKSATFHNFVDLRTRTDESTTLFVDCDEQVKCSSSRPSRKRSLLFEMGERIRLFSTGSFVTSSAFLPQQIPRITKTRSLNNFQETTVLPSSRCNQQRKNPSRLHPTSTQSIVSLRDQIDSSMDVEYGMDRTSSQLGVLCQLCSTEDIPCSKVQQDFRSPSVPSLYSLAASDISGNEPLCRICHCCWPSDASDPLISPCRCSGSLQHVHVSCLMHWLDISSRKLHRPAVCELCLYKYRRRRIIKYREIKLPECVGSDVRFYSLFISAILLMLLSALATIICFQLEKTYGVQSNTKSSDSSLSTTSTIPSDLLQVEHREQVENLLSTITLIAAIVFFVSFFLAMYAHVKSGLSFCHYLALCWSSNLEWSIEEYKQSRDSQYLSKLEELRRKINEKQKKAPDEIEPLRSSITVIE